ncbi:PaaI family thioesterase [Paraburkholderia caballeronis]|uniref:Uncharacterized domain 1-containing protein n=1 Tax=Paraburkholderia caballeronis TaxID=416943 RepID=A0A1H7K0X6_9BURK|nr:PaaI family thioesterase [Paraburkholderia caballeronis]PXW27179.1 uncharacterized protein (TIGR00369 family) [Paraburkholderia caballeronis]PXX02653.1 uncharacterized protein (TIGR00369 family) [Paraburkholderia caballeronis]RAK03378.1 uncharacterized protein (TIGR00369 family) [Paraburkholderia caballeronis]TDV11564.1 uncharacterized protein (TIGR00369 family) [Paraburkholderia caballeronis]TDV17429.1 uncharacterized protein (TIGR00369 family) [Paraburkholderia caballeronis]
MDRPITLSAAEADRPIPEGFAPLRRGGPYFLALGALYHRIGTDGGLVIALRVTDAHANMIGIAHGGMLATLADSAMGACVSLMRQTAGESPAMVTVSLTSEFLSAARVGDWLEAHARVRKPGRRVVFAECTLRAGGRDVLHASGVFVPAS